MEYLTKEGPLCLVSSAFCENDGISQIFEMEMKQILLYSVLCSKQKLLYSVLCLAKDNTTSGLHQIPCALRVLRYDETNCPRARYRVDLALVP